MLTFKLLARRIAALEGKKKPVNIGQINEILRITLMLLADEFQERPYAVITLLTRYYGKLDVADTPAPRKPPEGKRSKSQ